MNENRKYNFYETEKIVNEYLEKGKTTLAKGIEDLIKCCPRKPVEPVEEECCGSGCVPCVLDIYEDEIQNYREGIKAVMEKLNPKI